MVMPSWLEVNVIQLSLSNSKQDLGPLSFCVAPDLALNINAMDTTDQVCLACSYFSSAGVWEPHNLQDNNILGLIWDHAQH